MAYQEDIALMAPPDAPCGLRRRPRRARSARGQGIRSDRRGVAPPRDTAVGRCLHPAPLSAGVVAAWRAAPHGQREHHVSPGEHETSARRENGAVLAPRVRHRQLQGGQLRSAVGADRPLPQQGMGNYRDLLPDDRPKPDDDLLAGQQPEPRDGRQRELGSRVTRAVSMGVGAYTEKDVREASRAFTGWTFETKIPRLPLWAFPWKFEYRPEDHDDGEKEFLGHRGRFNARTSSTSSWNNRPVRASCAGTCTTSSSPTSPRCRPGRSSRRETRRRSIR